VPIMPVYSIVVALGIDSGLRRFSASERMRVQT
jgi:hypothetical protein